MRDNPDANEIMARKARHLATEKYDRSILAETFVAFLVAEC